MKQALVLLVQHMWHSGEKNYQAKAHENLKTQKIKKKI
jgi:hypothetical protein